MNEQENTRLAQQAYERFKTGDIQSLLDLYADDVEWELPAIESVPFTGKRQGRAAVADFFQAVNEAQEVLSFNPQEFIAQGDKVVVLGNYSWRVKATGREYSSDSCARGHHPQRKDRQLQRVSGYDRRCRRVSTNRACLIAKLVFGVLGSGCAK